ncbi:CBS domain-containing protein [Pseudonocardia xishanensis]|uniref:CBS domain-containing protein n=1 Tax=Pseudonocardia xishanensis TaxID=630995 RepID=A0ABP8S2K8_9PSEU
MSTLLDHETVADAMVRFPKTCTPTTTVRQAREVFEDGHVHALLVVERGLLLAVVECGDLVDRAADEHLRRLGTLRGRTIGTAADADAVRVAMHTAGRRRLAVVDGDGRLLGLLCLKRSGAGFCSDAGIRARAADRRP